VSRWLRLCKAEEAPGPGQVSEAEVEGVAICLANVNGELLALDNVCPHRGGPLGQGWVEGESVVCPWHSWTFHARTGEAEFPPGERVAVFPVRRDGDDVLVMIDNGSTTEDTLQRNSEA
jgi:nitrite reductase (NADH) small subunit